MKSVLRTGALFAALLFVVSEAQAANRVVKPLFAGQNTLVGRLVVENDSRYLYVTYDMTKAPTGMTGFVPGWTMQTTHLYVGKTAPRSAAPGRFPFKHEGLRDVSIDTYKIRLTTLAEVRCYTTLYIAAHADTCETGVPGVGACVPDYAALSSALPAGLTDMTITANNSTAHFTLNTSMGSFPGWCFDANGPIRTNWDDGNPATTGDQWDGAPVVYSTAYLAGLLADGTANPDAVALLGAQASGGGSSIMSALNYLVNQDYVRNCGTVGAPYTYWDIQVAIWVITNGNDTGALNGMTITILGDVYPVAAFGVDPADIRAILDDVNVNAPGFAPGCGELALVMVDPQTPILQSAYVHNQHVGFALPVTGTTTQGDCETAWAKGTCRIGTGWGTYFTYTVK